MRIAIQTGCVTCSPVALYIPPVDVVSYGTTRVLCSKGPKMYQIASCILKVPFLSSSQKLLVSWHNRSTKVGIEQRAGGEQRRHNAWAGWFCRSTPLDATELDQILP